MKIDSLEKLGADVLISVGIITLISGVGLLLAFPIKWTWNATMPYLFGWPTITWGKAWCLLFLSNCFIKKSWSIDKKD